MDLQPRRVPEPRHRSRRRGRFQTGRFRACAGVLRRVVLTLSFVNLDPIAQPLAKSLGELPQQAERFPFPGMKLFERRGLRHEMQLEDVRGQLSRGLPSAHRPTRLSTANSTSTPTPSNPRAPPRPPVEPDPRRTPGDATPRRYQEARDGLTTDYLWAFPNWMLNRYPDNVSLNMILPLEPERYSGHLRVLSSGKGFGQRSRPRVRPVQRRDFTRRRRQFVKPCRKTCIPQLSARPLQRWNKRRASTPSTACTREAMTK